LSDSPAPAIDAREVRRIAELAQLDVSDDDARALGADLARIVDHVRRIETLDLSGIPPTSHVVPPSPAPREDEPRPGLSAEDALDGAPKVESGHFVVPRVLPS
jgi:aspartyl-tRNA(Asn)/glutamyl-tRNA(Gln) amidotransferase subunit C